MTYRTPRMTLTFEELPLQEAIRKVFEHPDFVRSEVLLITDKGREWILQNVIVNLPIDLVGDYRFEHILLSVNQFRKLGKEALRKRLIVLEHARNMKDPCCFYQGKVGSVCSREVDLDRVKPGKRGGRYSIDNTVLSCARHNRSRGCKEVVAYWEQ